MAPVMVKRADHSMMGTVTDRMQSRILVPFDVHRRSRAHWLRWLRDEWKKYADPKFDANREEVHDPHMRNEGVGEGSWWENQVLQYIRRASVLGLDNPLGRQALCKGLACYTGMVESMIRVHGDPPAPGVPSGEIT